MTKQGSLDNIITYEHYCDTVADLSNIPSSQITLGSVAIVVNDEDEGMGIYIANSQKEWTPISTSISGGGSGEVLLDLIHVCSSSEYDSVTKVPTVEDAESNKIYLVPNSESGNNAFDEWIYADEAWERFGGGSINVPVTDVQVNSVSVLNAQGVANIPVADNNNLGVVRPAAKTSAMTQGVGVDSSGALWTKPAPTNPIASNGIPTGGTTGQVLKKTGSADYAAGWSGMALNDLSNVSARQAYDTDKYALVYNNPTNTWVAGKPVPGAQYNGYVDQAYDPATYEPIEDTYCIYLDNGQIDPLYTQYVADSAMYVLRNTEHELYWSTYSEEDDYPSAIYLIDRASGTPFNRNIKRFAYDGSVGGFVEAPLALVNEVTGMWTGTQAQYDALATKDAHTVYFIQE